MVANSRVKVGIIKGSILDYLDEGLGNFKLLQHYNYILLFSRHFVGATCSISIIIGWQSGLNMALDILKACQIRFVFIFLLFIFDTKETFWVHIVEIV